MKTVYERISRRIAGLPPLLWAILALALVLRFFQLTESGLWTDEAFSVNVARLPFWEMGRKVAWDGVHPPFFYFLLHPWILIFGDSEVAVRSLSALYGVLAVFLIYGVGARLYSRNVGLVAAFLLATSSFFLFYSQDIRMYMFMAPPALLSFYALYRLVFDRRLVIYALYFFSTVVLLYTHIFGVFYVLAQNVYYLGLMFLGRDNRPALGHWIALQSATVLAFVPWLPFVFDKMQRQRDRGFWLEAPDLDAIILLFGSFIGSTLGLIVAAGVLGVAAFFSVRRVWSRRRQVLTAAQFRKEGLLILWAVLPVLVTALYSILVNPILYPRYVLPSAIPIFVLLAYVIVTWAQRAARNTIIAGVLLLPLTAYQVYMYYADDIRANHYRLPHDWRSATDYLIENSDEDTVIICPGTCHPLEYYLRSSTLRNETVPILRKAGRKLEARKDRLVNKTAGYQNVWFVRIDGRDPDNIVRDILAADRQLSREIDVDGWIGLDLYQRGSAD